MTKREKLTEGQRKALQRAADQPLGLYKFADGRRGPAKAARTRMLDRLCALGFMQPYPHDDEYEITPAGRTALQERI